MDILSAIVVFIMHDIFNLSMSLITKNTIMKKVKFILPLLMLGFVYIGTTSCKKKETGTCYCGYVNGNKTEFDLSAVSRSVQIDSCYVLSQNASNFGGSCDLK